MELVIAAWLLAAAVPQDAPPKPPKSDLSHMPPGNPANAHTLSLPESAFAARLGARRRRRRVLGGRPRGGRADQGDKAGKIKADKADKAEKAEKADAKGKKSKSPVCHMVTRGARTACTCPRPRSGPTSVTAMRRVRAWRGSPGEGAR